MNIERQFTADHINSIVNHPEVYPWVCGSANGQVLDLSGFVRDQNNVVLGGKHAAIAFHQHQFGYYEVHTQVLPEGRGQYTVDFVNAALHWMFTRTGAVELVTRVPKGNLPARALVKAIHGSFEFRKENGWVKDGLIIPADIFALRIQEWIKTSPLLPQRGQWFHDRLEHEYKKIGVAEDVHEDDDVHDRHVGAAVDMMLGGQAHKGAVFYNRWAAMAGYAPVEIITEQPLLIDIRDAVLVIRNNDFWVMECRLRRQLEQ